MVYGGNNSTPLTLDYLIIQNGTSSSSTTTSTFSLPTSTGNATSNPNGSPDRVGFIVGGVIGGLALLVFAISGFLLLRRRQKRNLSTSTARPFDYTPLHLSSSSTPSSSGGFSYSQVPQTAQLGSRMPVKGQVSSHVSVPSITITESTEPPSTSSGVFSYPSNLRAVPFQQPPSNLASLPSPSSLSPLASGSSSPAQVIPLPSKVERQAEALASVRPQRRRNPSVPVSVQSDDDKWLSNPNVVLHADSGIRMPSDATSTSVVDIPPLYTPD